MDRDTLSIRSLRTLLQEHHTLKLRLVLDGLVVGLLAGGLSILYRLVLALLERLRAQLSAPWHLALFVLFLLLAPFVCSWLLKWAPLSGGSGIPQVEGELIGAFHMHPMRTVTAKFIGGSLANFAGQSLGREGPSIQLGGAIGKQVARWMKRSRIEEKYMISAGAAAGLSAAFNAPISAVLFTLEEVHKSFHPLLFVPAMIASVIADCISRAIFGFHPVFFLKSFAPLPLKYYPLIVFVAVFISLIGILFTKGILFFQELYAKIPGPKAFKLAIPFLLCLPVIAFLPEISGGGHHLIDHLVDWHPSQLLLLFLLAGKLLFTLICYGSGIQGGIFLPLLSIGALSGFSAYHIFSLTGLIHGDYYNNLIIIGMACMMAAVVRAPLLSVLLVTEMTASFSHLLSLCIAVFISYIVAEALNIAPIYDLLLERMVKKRPRRRRERLLLDYKITPMSPWIGQCIKDLPLPPKCLIISIRRNHEEFTPDGESEIQVQDELLFVTEEDSVASLRELFSELSARPESKHPTEAKPT